MVSDGRRYPLLGQVWRVQRLSLLLLLLLLPLSRSSAQTSGSQASATPQPQNATASPSTVPALLIGTGDLLTVDIFNTPELSGKFRVGQSGSINLQQGGQVHVAGLSPTEASRAIEARLREASIMLDPHATVLVSEYGSQGVIVLGQVKSPGTYPLLGDSSLYGALAAAGGTTINQGGSITISHQGEPGISLRIMVSSSDYSQVQHTTAVRPGDTVYVSTADPVYVIGDVGRSGVIMMANGVHMNVLEALAVAEGPNRTAKLSHISIVRQTSDGVVTIPVDLRKIVKNKAPDPYLQAADVLVVPRSGTRAFLDSAVPGATAAVLSSLVTAIIIR